MVIMLGTAALVCCIPQATFISATVGSLGGRGVTQVSKKIAGVVSKCSSAFGTLTKYSFTIGGALGFTALADLGIRALPAIAASKALPPTVSLVAQMIALPFAIAAPLLSVGLLFGVIHGTVKELMKEERHLEPVVQREIEEAQKELPLKAVENVVSQSETELNDESSEEGNLDPVYPPTEPYPYLNAIMMDHPHSHREK